MACYRDIFPFTFTILQTGREIGWDGMDWIDLAQNRDQWRALVRNFGFHKMLGSYCVAAQVVTSQEGLNSISDRKVQMNTTLHLC
jgi:hypothetical protein